MSRFQAGVWYNLILLLAVTKTELSAVPLKSFIFKLSSGSDLQSHELSISGNHTSGNVTYLLNNLLKQYDNSLRPGLGGAPLHVEINMQVRSMGPISEVDMSYSMDCYFRQSWVDERLAFSGERTLALSIEMLRKIWKPDTYIFNGRKSYLHTITTPNRFMRLFPNGRVLYSQRLTIRASCQMDLSDFPMDKQKCPLLIGSFGYTTHDVIYDWSEGGRGVNIASDMKLSQFDLISTPVGNKTTFLNKGLHSTLLVSFHLQRHMGNFVIQVYGPCVLLVVISWVSFWLNREATSDRISLGVTTVLTMTFLGLEARTDLPEVSYPTALDYFVFISFMFIFSTVVQFALVHYFTKVGSGEYYLEDLEETECMAEKLRKEKQQFDESLKSRGSHYEKDTLHKSACQIHYQDVLPDEDEDQSSLEDEFLPKSNEALFRSLLYQDDIPDPPPPPAITRARFSSRDRFAVRHNCLNHHPYSAAFFSSKRTGRTGRKLIRSPPIVIDQPVSFGHDPLVQIRDQIREWDKGTQTPRPRAKNLRYNWLPKLPSGSSSSKRSSSKDAPSINDSSDECQCKRCITRALNNPEKALNSVSKIDKISRIVFPFTFIVLNVFYWYSYLKHSERIDLSFESS